MSDFESDSLTTPKMIIIIGLSVVAVTFAVMYFLNIGIFAQEPETPAVQQVVQIPEPVPQLPQPEPVIQEPVKPVKTREQIVAEHQARYEQRQQTVEQPTEGKLTTFTADFHPPRSNRPVITGNYNNKTNWYYGSAPVATFTATDDYSGIKYIIVQYKQFSVKCRNYECYLNNGDTLTLNRQTGVNKGHVKLNYFAVDNTNKTEHVNHLAVWYDGVVPEIYVPKIYTESKQVPVGSSCKANLSLYQCVLIHIKGNETLTFEVLASDRISGIDKLLYRVVQPLNPDAAWQTVENTIPQHITLSFAKPSNYRLQIKATDIAGNESAVKEFWIRVT